MTTTPSSPPDPGDPVGEQFLQLLSKVLYEEQELAAVRERVREQVLLHQQKASEATKTGRWRIAASHEGHVDGLLDAWSMITGTPWVRRPADST